MKKHVNIFLFILALGVAGCKENEPVIPVVRPTKMQIVGLPYSLYKGDECQLSVTFDVETDNKPTWSVNNAIVASIDENGKLIALSEGQAKITATVDDLVAEGTVFIQNDYIVFERKHVSTSIGGVVQVNARLYSDRYAELQWTSSNHDIFIVTSSGGIDYGLSGKMHCEVRGKSIGKAYLRVSYNSIIDSCLVAVEELNGAENGKAWVNMGLGVKWATMNVGANAISEDGICVAWGETEPKYAYNWGTYKWCVTGPYIADGAYHDTYLSKYQLDDNFGPYYRIDTIRTEDGDFTKEEYVKVFIGDGKSVLDPEDDAAHVKWGGNWRMPTYEECKELIENCTWEEVLYDGVYGYKATSKFTNQWLFFPATRHKDGYESVGNRHSFVWSSQSTLNAHAAYLSLSNGSYDVSTYYSAIGCYVRGVVE